MIAPARFLERARLLDAPVRHGGRRATHPWRARPNPGAIETCRSHFGWFRRMTGAPLVVVERRCCRCHRWRNAEVDFPQDRSRAGGIDPRCLDCVRKRQ